MRYLLLYWVFSFLAPAGWAQFDTLFKYERTLVGDIRLLTADHLGNLYLIDRKDQVKKVGATGDSLAVYNDVRRFGPLSGIDVSNPMQPILFYGDGVRFVVLDRFLNPVTQINLQASNIVQLQAWVRSYDNQLWIYDPLAYVLRKVDLNGTIGWSTSDFRLILGRPFSPARLFDQDRSLYLYEPNQGVFVFDYFGNLKNGIQIYDWSDWQVDGGFMYGRKADTLYRYEIKTTYYEEWVLPAELQGAIQVVVKGKKLYALIRGVAGDRIRIYTTR
ncbi:MAG: hypothetical protein FJX92_00640 [Bacteroidetes bacterium]|nr:hypothetical protein [Bacteroidota bacterium]